MAISEPPSSDSETRIREDHHDSLRLWLRLLSCSTLIENYIRQRLQADFATTLPRFDLMAQLERCPEGLKMGELSKRLMVTGGNVTGITDLLENEGRPARLSRQTDSERPAFIQEDGCGARALDRRTLGRPGVQAQATTRCAAA
jgi:hypothetical protein